MLFYSFFCFDRCIYLSNTRQRWGLSAPKNTLELENIFQKEEQIWGLFPTKLVKKVYAEFIEAYWTCLPQVGPVWRQAGLSKVIEPVEGDWACRRLLSLSKVIELVEITSNRLV